MAEIGNVSAYVYRSLRNRIVDRLRARKPTVPLEEDAEEGRSLAEILPHPDPDPHGEMERSQRDLAFAEALRSLPPQDRILIEANEFEGRTFQELSEEWNVPIGTLLSRKSRAIRKLSTILAEHSPRT